MENKIIEQPELESEAPIEDIDNASTLQEGSILGRFKDAKSLMEAYNSLHAEFTRKCQKLADFQKEKEENAFYFKENSLDEILKDSTNKEEYKKEVTEILSKNEQLSSLPNKYLVAFKIIDEANKKTTSKLNDPDFIDNYIENNPEIKNKIISAYLSKLNNISSAPKVISGNSTNIFFTPNENKPKTLKEAGDIFNKMLN